MSRVRVIAAVSLVLGLAAAAALMRRTPPASPTETGATRVGKGHADVSDGGAAATDASQAPRDPALRRPSGDVALGGTALLGSVVAPTQATLTVRAPVRIRSVFAREGASVRAGQPLVELDETELTTQERTSEAGQAAARAQVRRAIAGLEAQRVKAGADVDTAGAASRQAETRLQQALLARRAADAEQKADVRAATEAVHKAQIGYDRAQDTLRGLEDLSRVGGVSRSDLEGARAQAHAAQSDLDSAKGQLDRLQAAAGQLPFRVASADKDVDAARSGVVQASDAVSVARNAGRQALRVAAEDVRAARAALDQATAGLSGARAARSQVRLISPIAGVVTALPARAGETAQPATPLVVIVSMAGLRVDALVPARLLALFHGGQAATVSVDTAPGRGFRAIVSEIPRVAEPDGRTFRVKFRLLGAPPLLPGQTARIRVDTAP